MTNAQITSNNAAAATPAHDNGQKFFSQRFYLYHANANNTGSAIRISVAPATNESEGALFISMASQAGVAGQTPEGLKQFPHFDWMNRTTVKFGVSEVAQMIQVLRGRANSVNGEKGFYHDSRATTTGITFARQTDPMPGFNLAFMRTPKDGVTQHIRTWFFFREYEALALETILTAALPIMALGNFWEQRSAQFGNSGVRNSPPLAAGDTAMPF